MNLTIEKSELYGEISAISSKSHAHRALICAALSRETSKIYCKNLSADINATVNCLIGLGADIVYENDIFTVKPIDISKAKSEIDCGESGSTLRFLLPIIAALGLNVTINMHARLPQRPLFPLDRELEKKGCKLKKSGNSLAISGKLQPSVFEIEGNISSQFITGLLFTLPLLNGKSEIVVKGNLESYSYILLSLSVLKEYGIEYEFENNTFKLLKCEYKSNDLNIEGDWSNAAFWLCAGALSKKGITVKNLNFQSVQGDKKIIDVLKDFGACINVDNSSVSVKYNKLNAIELDASDIPDLVPIISLVASCANGETVIKNAQRLRIKESDRIKTVVELINNLGGKATETNDGMIICGTSLTGGCVDSYNDHRIAMTAAIASQICENNINLIGAEAVKKSYPDFFDDFKKLKGIIKEETR